jgi:hypothetical protein
MYDNRRGKGETMREPRITINGIKLSDAQSCTIRASIESLASSLELHSLGQDEHGIFMTKAYKARIYEIRKMIFPDLEYPKGLDNLPTDVIIKINKSV